MAKHSSESSVGIDVLVERWRTGGPCMNAWLSIGSSYLAEVVAGLAYVCVTVDLQHGMFGIETAIEM